MHWVWGVSQPDPTSNMQSITPLAANIGPYGDIVTNFQVI